MKRSETSGWRRGRRLPPARPTLIAFLHPSRARMRHRRSSGAWRERPEPDPSPGGRSPGTFREHYLCEARAPCYRRPHVSERLRQHAAGGVGRVRPEAYGQAGGGLCSGIGSAAAFLADCPAPGSLRPARIAQSSRRLAGNAGRPETRKWRRKGLRRLNPRPEMAPRWRRLGGGRAAEARCGRQAAA